MGEGDRVCIKHRFGALMSRRITLVVFWFVRDMETGASSQAQSGPRELSLRPGESLYDCLVKLVPQIRWRSVSAEWEVRLTARASNGTTNTTYRTKIKYCSLHDDQDGLSTRDKMTRFQQEIEASAMNYNVFIHDGEVVPFWPK